MVSKRNKRNWKIADLDADAEVTLFDEAHGRIDDNLMFDTGVFEITIDAIPLATKSPICHDEAEMKKHMEIVPNDEVATDAIPLATKSPIINIDIEDLETLWKLVKAKHGITRPEEAYERVLWGDLKVKFEPDVESEVWRNLQGYSVTVWKLFSSSGVHFVRF
ncbi:hypothetical protein Tco_0927335 [Tanacetum coccineum]